MFWQKNRYRHVSCLDIDIYVVKCITLKDRMKLKVLYLDRFTGDCLFTKAENVTVQKKDAGNWKRIL